MSLTRASNKVDHFVFLQHFFLQPLRHATFTQEPQNKKQKTFLIFGKQNSQEKQQELFSRSFPPLLFPCHISEE